MPALTAPEAVTSLRALGIRLTPEAIDEMQTASDSDVQLLVAFWLEVLQPADMNVLLSRVVQILGQVTEWVGVAEKVALLFGVPYETASRIARRSS